jgi:hypothetical protein
LGENKSISRKTGEISFVNDTFLYTHLGSCTA